MRNGKRHARGWAGATRSKGLAMYDICRDSRIAPYAEPPAPMTPEQMKEKLKAKLCKKESHDAHS